MKINSVIKNLTQVRVVVFFAVVTASLIFIGSAQAFWLWDPKTNRIINPKYMVKDTPEEQYDWAMSFFNNNEFDRSGDEFVRLVSSYPNSSLAPDAQYYAGAAYEKAGKYYVAFENYKKVIKNYPFTKKMDNIIEAMYNIGEIYYKRSTASLMGVELMTDAERSLEIFTSVIESMPYSSYAAKAQYMIGMSQKKLQQYAEAVTAFQKVVQEYPKSDLVDKAKYEVVQCMNLASHGPDYDQGNTDQAIKEFKKYVDQSEDQGFKNETKGAIDQLVEKKAASIYNIALFYEQQKKYKAAYIYFSKIIEDYPDSSYTGKASNKMQLMTKKLESEKK